jgi:hypothetical protein
MSLPDNIAPILRADSIPCRFRVADIQCHLSGIFASNYIRTALCQISCDNTPDIGFRRVPKLMSYYAILQNAIIHFADFERFR